VSRANEQDQRALVNDYEDSIMIKDYSQFDRKELEEYMQLLIQFSKANESLLQRYVFGIVHWLLQES
jgi:hypothetical protein